MKANYKVHLADGKLPIGWPKPFCKSSGAKFAAQYDNSNVFEEITCDACLRKIEKYRKTEQGRKKLDNLGLRNA